MVYVLLLLFVVPSAYGMWDVSSDMGKPKKPVGTLLLRDLSYLYGYNQAKKLGDVTDSQALQQLHESNGRKITKALDDAVASGRSLPELRTHMIETYASKYVIDCYLSSYTHKRTLQNLSWYSSSAFSNLAFHPTTHSLYASVGRAIHEIDVQQDQKKRVLVNEQNICCMAFHPITGQLDVGSKNSISVWNVDEGTCVDTVKAQPLDALQSLAFGPSRAQGPTHRYIAAKTGIMTMDLANGNSEEFKGKAGAATSLAAHPTTGDMYGANKSGYLYNLSNNSRTADLKNYDSAKLPAVMAFHPRFHDYLFVATGYNGKIVHVQDSTASIDYDWYNSGYACRDLAFHPTTHNLYVLKGGDLEEYAPKENYNQVAKRLTFSDWHNYEMGKSPSESNCTIS